MLDNAYEAAGRAASYLSKELETSSLEYIPDYPPNYVKKGPGGKKLRVDSFTDFCLDVLEGDIEQIEAAIHGQGLGDEFWSIDASFEGVTDSIACELEVPACSLTISDAFEVVKDLSDDNSCRISRSTVYEDRSVMMEYAGGGRVELRPMMFSKPTDEHRLVAERTYKHLRAHNGTPYANLSKIPGLKGADCIEPFSSIQDGDIGESTPRVINRDADRRPGGPYHTRGPHLCISPKGLALEFQSVWQEIGGEKIRLSRCQEAVARYLGAKNWQHLVSIDANRYWTPVVVSVGNDAGVTDQWVSHSFYRNAKEGLAAFADFVDEVKVQHWSFYTGFYGNASLTVTAKFDEKYVQVRPFTTMLIEKSKSENCPEAIFNEEGTGLSAEMNEYLGVGESLETHLRRRDQEKGSATLVLQGLKIRAVPTDGFREYIVVEATRDDGSRLERIGDGRSDDTYLVHHKDDQTYEIVVEESSPTYFKSIGIFEDHLTPGQNALLLTIFRNTGWMSCDTLAEVLETGRDKLDGQEIDRRFLSRMDKMISSHK